MRLRAAPEIRLYQNRPVTYAETDILKSILFIVIGYLMVSALSGSTTINSASVQSMNSWTTLSLLLFGMYIATTILTILQFVSIWTYYTHMEYTYRATAIVLISHMSVAFTLFDWTNDYSTTPIRFILVAFVAFAAGNGALRSYTMRLAKNKHTDLVMIAKHAIDAVACTLVLFFFEFLPVYQRSSLTKATSLPDHRCFNSGTEDLSSFSVSSGEFGADQMHTPIFYFATITTIAFGASTFLSSYRWFLVIVNQVTPKYLSGRKLQTELWLRGVTFPVTSLVLIFYELRQHTLRMSYDSMTSRGRECAPFMERSLRYFATVGLELQGDCHTPLHLHAAHCGACLHGGFGVATLGEDLISSHFIITVLAAWLIADSGIALLLSRQPVPII
jgi:hypothetical protein